jgi:hypothetical protein
MVSFLDLKLRNHLPVCGVYIDMKWIARVFVFTAALIFGAFAASLFYSPATATQLTAQNLLGTWKGHWGHNDGVCTIVIDRVEGNAFYGTLRKEGAEIRIEGMFNPNTRMLLFDETQVVHIGGHMSGWSLGKNSGILSQDGRILVGDGYDERGQYGWAASNY